MKIEEQRIRQMIRRAILLEVTSFGKARLGASIEEATDCPYSAEIPEKLASVFNSTTSQEFIQKLSQKFPKLGKDFAAFGVGQSQRGSGIYRGGLDPLDIGSVTKSNNPIQILAGYVNSYLSVIGLGCLQYYYLTLLLDFLGTVLGVEDASVAATKAKENSSNYGRKFIEGITEKAENLSGSFDRSGFANNYAFYALPVLSKEGPNSDNIDALDEDLDGNQKKIDAIRRISRSDDPNNAFLEICDILDIESTAFYQSLKGELEGIKDNPELTEELKRKSIADLLISIQEARKSFREAEVSNREFSDKIMNFFGRNTSV